jgi:hypothetical protein
VNRYARASSSSGAKPIWSDHESAGGVASADCGNALFQLNIGVNQSVCRAGISLQMITHGWQKLTLLTDTG